MKRFMLLSALVIAMPLSMLAQDDDLYFTPKKQKAEVQETGTTYYCGSDRSLDEYNRRGQYRSKVQAIDGTDSLDFVGTMGMYPDSVYNDTLFVDRFNDYVYNDEDDSDYTYSRMMDRWYGCYDPWFYGPGFHHFWSPFYSGFWGYDPWYYGWGGYYGFYDPWYYGYGWGGYYGWYDPWYYGYGWGYPYGGWGFGGGWGHGGDFAMGHIGRGNSAAVGGHSGSVGVGRRGSANTFNQIAQRQTGATGVTGGTRSGGSRATYGTGRRTSSTSVGTRGTSTSRSSSYTPSTSSRSYTPSSSSSYSGSRSSSGGFSGGSHSSGGFSGGGHSGGGGGGHSGRR